MLALVLVLLSQVTPDSRVSRVERVPGGRMEGGRGGVKGWAFFEAFPVGGAGSFGACSTTPPTGAKGEALTFARTGTATCTATATGGLATTGIANGDLVVMSANLPRVEYDSNGVKGLLVEAARTNLQPRSQELDNATWGRTAGGSSSAPTIPSTNNTAPDNTATAERLSFSACPTVGDYSQLAQLVATSAVAHSNSVYMRAVSGTATISVCGFGSTGVCTQCTADDKAWTRCVLNNWTGAASAYFVAGCINNTAAYTGATNTGAADVYLWGVQMEVGAYASSYIPTTSAAATRNAETATFTVSPSVGPNFSLAATTQWPSAAAFPTTMVSFGTSGASVISLYKWTDTAAGYNFAGVGTNPAVPAMGTTPRRSVGADASGTRSAYWDGSSVSAPASSLGSAQSLVSIGTSGTGTVQADGIVSRICLDPSPTRCR